MRQDVAHSRGDQTNADDDSHLAEGVRRRSQKAFLTLVDRFHNPMVRLAMVSNLDAVLAGQVVERVWLDVIEMIEERGDGPLKVWIFRLLLIRAGKAALSPTNTGSRPKSPAVDPHVFMGQNTRWPGHWSAFPAEWSGFLETTTGSQRARDVVQRGIEALPFEVRRVVVLRDIEGWTASEVSELLGVSEGDQAGLLHEGRTQLRRDIAEEVLRP